MTLIMYLEYKSKPENSITFLHYTLNTFSSLLIVLRGLKQTLLDQVLNNFEICLAVTKEADILRENAFYNYYKDLIDIN